MVCVDTDFVVALLRKEEAAIEKLKELREEKITTTPITASELFKGAYGASNPGKEIKRIKNILSYVEILEYSIDACERYGKIVNELMNEGAPIGDLDTIIASIAITHNEALITKDEHFKKVPSLIVESW